MIDMSLLGNIERVDRMLDRVYGLLDKAIPDDPDIADQVTDVLQGVSFTVDQMAVRVENLDRSVRLCAGHSV
ncbi:hypothetical protein [Actinokineospora sp. NBRC 105648]|uniref:hypothetical protein n=1 Tax=Actinokineospora sp. NBRC 105648 TaxID=3032206 RepID=UPI0024A21D75|nr:hypothetical protein [Actinokineospora sp. NBRC 105648]GLZ43722.1 hypothetical protein Acsp05_73460 [Actinokineospora sp. NBRC 105648]